MVLNSRKQGDVGTAHAITYFVTKGYTVSIPLSDSQTYDLIAEKDGFCNRVQVKTVFKRKENKYFYVELRTISNTRGKKLETRFLDKTKCDSVFILTSEDDRYIVPIESLTGLNGINVKHLEIFRINGSDTNN